VLTEVNDVGYLCWFGLSWCRYHFDWRRGAVVDMLLVGWWSWTSGISLKARCSGASVIVGRVRVDEWWRVIGFGQRLGVDLHLGGDVGWFIAVALSGLFSGLKQGGRQMLGLTSRSYIALNTKVWVKGHRRGYERGQR
jgi:hypothetical protein